MPLAAPVDDQPIEEHTEHRGDEQRPDEAHMGGPEDEMDLDSLTVLDDERDEIDQDHRCADETSDLLGFALLGSRATLLGNSRVRTSSGTGHRTLLVEAPPPTIDSTCANLR